MAGRRAKRFRYGAVLAAAPAVLCLSPATAWADESIVIDFVRHGETAANATGILDTAPPGDPLNAAGDQQAHIVAEALAHGAPYAGIYASSEVRTGDTADYLAQALNLSPNDVQVLPGLDEIDAGIFNGQPVDSLDGILYLLSPISWVLGLDLVPELGDPSLNGVAFDEAFSGAVQTIYDNTVSAAGSTTDAAFSSEGAITVWTLMNVNNPDLSAIFTTYADTGQLLPNTGQVVVEGEPGDWTLVDYNGIAVPQNPGLPTELLVDLRNLIEAPQFAAYNVYEALLTDDPTTITNAVEAGLNQVDAALMQFPTSVANDIVGELQDVSAAVTTGGPGEMSAIIADLLGSI